MHARTYTQTNTHTDTDVGRQQADKTREGTTEPVLKGETITVI